MMSEARYNVDVNVETHFLEGESDIPNQRYVFAYTITIKNSGNIGVQLLSRHWIIVDSNEKVQEIHGEGVVGEQPFLRPGESFQYTSGTLIETPVGTMRGSYQMLAEDGSPFDAKIMEFALVAPRVLH